MKNLFTIIIILLLLSACINDSPKNRENISNTNTPVINNVYKEYNKGVQLKLILNDYKYSKDSIKFKYQIKNIDNYQVSLGEGFDLEYLDNNKWIHYIITMNVLSYEIMVFKNDSAEFKHTFSINELKTGKYRMFVDVAVVLEKYSKRENFKLYSEFEITK